MSRASIPAGQLPLPLPPLTAFGAQDFLVTTSNSAAAAWIGRWPEWGDRQALALCGASGSGKTHLAHIALARAGGGRMLRGDDLPKLMEDRARPWGLMVLEDASRVAESAEHERALFHVLNSIQECRGSLLLTDTHAPVTWGVALPDLRSRVLALPLAVLAPPDDDLLAALLLKLCRDHQMELDRSVADFLLPRLPRDGHELMRLVAALDAASLAGKRKLTVPLTRDVLRDIA